MTNQFRTLGLVFENPESEGVSASPFACVYLQTFATAEFPGFAEPIHRLTPVEYNPDVFDVQVDQLIENLKELKREARQKFDAAKRRPFVPKS